MTIKELCKYKHSNYKLCKQCIFYNACPFYYAHWERPLNTIDDADNEMITKAVIETAKKLQEDEEVIGKIRTDIEKLTIYHTTKQGSELLTKKSVMRIIDKYKASNGVMK